MGSAAGSGASVAALATDLGGGGAGGGAFRGGRLELELASSPPKARCRRPGAGWSGLVVVRPFGGLAAEEEDEEEVSRGRFEEDEEEEVGSQGGAEGT